LFQTNRFFFLGWSSEFINLALKPERFFKKKAERLRWLIFKDFSWGEHLKGMNFFFEIPYSWY
jgi:hypothetical protein